MENTTNVFRIVKRYVVTQRGSQLGHWSFLGPGEEGNAMNAQLET